MGLALGPQSSDLRSFRPRPEECRRSSIGEIIVKGKQDLELVVSDHIRA